MDARNMKRAPLLAPIQTRIISVKREAEPCVQITGTKGTAITTLVECPFRPRKPSLRHVSRGETALSQTL